MKTFAALLIASIALTAACAAHAQERPALPPAAAGCIAPACEPGAAPAAIDEFAPPDWRAFQLPPARHVGGLLIRQENTLFDPAEFNAHPPQTTYPLIRDEQSWEQKISRMKELPLLTLWRTDGSKIFFGVNSDGFAGLNFSQNPRAKPRPTSVRSDSLTGRPIGPLAPPLAHAQSLTYQKKDLSGALAAKEK
ncbi:MAG: hypothetical protein V3S53_06820 [Gammaproteobacteria bacterium]